MLITVPEEGAAGNPYIDLLTTGIEGAGVQPIRFSWKHALIGQFDIVHFHWPEHLFVSSSKRKLLPKLLLSFLFICRLWLSRVPVVTTVHNLKAHDTVPTYVQVFSRATAALSDLYIYLNESHENDPDEGVVILHQVYPRTREPEGFSPAHRQPTVLYFGSLRPYKGLEDVVHAFNEAKAEGLLEPDVRLLIAGQAFSFEYAASIRRLTAGEESIEFREEFLADDELEKRISESIGIVLPYKRMYNSGAAILALGLGARVLVPSGLSTMALQKEFPSGVTLFEGRLRGAELALLATGRIVDQGELREFRRRRSISSIGDLHRRVYGSLVGQPFWGSKSSRRSRALEILHSQAAIRMHSGRNCGKREQL